jgi:hypothetical protein
MMLEGGVGDGVGAIGRDGGDITGRGRSSVTGGAMGDPPKGATGDTIGVMIGVALSLAGGRGTATGGVSGGVCGARILTGRTLGPGRRTIRVISLSASSRVSSTMVNSFKPDE